MRNVDLARRAPLFAFALLVECIPWTGTAHAACIDHGDAIHPGYIVGGLLLAQLALAAFLIAYDRRNNPPVGEQTLAPETTHNARLALAGELTASIAHEIARPLSAILSNVETAELLIKQSVQAADAETLSPILADIKRADLRANEIVDRLRALLRKRELKRESVDLNTLVSSVLALVHADADHRQVQLRSDLEPHLPRISGDPVHLQQVLLNLLLNAMDAMGNTAPSSRWLHLQTRLHAASIEVCIRDNGHGIDPAHAEKMFESFSTTKRSGMGLGLSIARAIVHAHGGTIWAERASGGGSIFTIRLPLPRGRSVLLTEP